MKKKQKPAESLATYGLIGAYGIWDLRANIWLGTDRGPLTYTDSVTLKGIPATGHELASMALAVFTKRLAYNRGRLVVKIYDGSGTAKKDDVNTIMSGAQAIAEIEKGK